MQHHYAGLSDRQVLENRERYGANIITPPAPEGWTTRVKQISSLWLIRLLLGVVLMTFLILPMLDIFYTDLPCQMWLIMIVWLLVIVLTYVVAFLGGHFNTQTNRYELDPMICILLLALGLSGAIGCYEDVFLGADGITPYLEPLGIAVAVLLATGVTYVLERKNEKTFRALNEINDEEPVKVVREHRVMEVPRREVVVGDIILLETGDEVPADAELLEAMDLIVNESSLTGEPECDKTTERAQLDLEAIFPSNHVMKTCTVLNGEAIAQVYAVGDNTVAGESFVAASIKEQETTPLQKQLFRMARTVTIISYMVAALIIVGRLCLYLVGNAFGASAGWLPFVKYLLDTVMIAVTLLVVTIPEGLPMAVTLSLAFSMRRLMKQNTLPRTMHACETMGATTIICTDKTGTLTQNQMRVKESCFLHSEVPGFAQHLWEGIALNTTANLNLSASPQVIGNPTEGALLLWMYEQGQFYAQYRTNYQVQERLSFSTERKYMATIVKTDDDRRILYVKGAPDVLLKHCQISHKDHLHYTKQLTEYQQHAYRTLGLAYREMAPDEVAWIDGRLVVSDLRMLGVVAIADPIREDVPKAIRDCMRAGIDVMIISGDAPGTTKEIARQLGMWQDTDTDKAILLGTSMEYIGDKELQERLREVKIVARARPNDKERIVRLLRQMGHVVAVTGDGTNDAPALNAANIGLSMGDGTAVAKEASDMTIMDNSFTTISKAVMWGRSLYKNIQRFILFQLTVNVGACLIVMIGAFTGTQSPLTVTQMLWVNLILDTFAALALSSLPPSQRTMRDKPRSIKEPILHRLEKHILGVGVVMACGLLGILLLFQRADVVSLLPSTWQWNVPHGLSPYELGLFFTIFVMLQLWNLFNARAFMTNQSVFKGLSWRKTPLFIAIVLVIFVGQILIVELPCIQEMFSIPSGGLRWLDWLIILVGTSAVLWIGELRRKIRYKRSGLLFV